MLPKSLSTSRSWILPLIIFFASFILRLCLISKGPYHLDCLTLALNAQKALVEHQLPYQFGTGYPLTVLTGALFVGLAKILSINDSVFAVNLMSVWLSSFSVLIFFLFIKNIFNTLTALLCALALSLHPIFLTLSVYGNSHIVSFFFLILGLYFLTKRENPLRNIGFTICLGLMGAARIQDMVLMLIPTAFFWWSQQSSSQKDGTKTFCQCFFFAVVIAVAFHLPYLLTQEHGQYQSQLKEFWTLGLTSNFAGFISPSLARALAIIGISTTFVGTLIAAYGFIRLTATQIRTGIFLAFWFLCPLLFYGNVMTIVPRFLLLPIAALLIAEAYGLSLLWNTKHLVRKLIIAAVFAMMLLLPFFTNILPILQFRHSHTLLPDWARFIEKNTESVAYLIVGDEELFIHTYGHRKTLTKKMAMEEFKTQLSRLLAKNVPVYITETGLYVSNPSPEFSSYIKSTYHLELRGKKTVEDWHGGELMLETRPDKLYRIYKN